MRIYHKDLSVLFGHRSLPLAYLANEVRDTQGAVYLLQSDAIRVV